MPTRTSELTSTATTDPVWAPGDNWATEDFMATDDALLECLAPYYTHCVLKRSEWDDAFGVYQRLLDRQPPNYREHLPLVRDSKPEEVRAAMFKVRQQGHRRLLAMKRALAEERDALRTEAVIPIEAIHNTVQSSSCYLGRRAIKSDIASSAIVVGSGTATGRGPAS